MHGDPHRGCAASNETGIVPLFFASDLSAHAKRWAGLAALALALTGCGSGGVAADAIPVQLSVDFQRGLGGAESGFADYPAGEEAFYELDSGWEPVPDVGSRNGVYLNGNNHSDDLFMFLAVPLDGLQPGVRYRVDFSVEFATNAGQGCVGIGGAPGESVTVKAGATMFKPQSQTDGDGWLRMNLDKGNQSQGGEDALALGNFAGTQSGCDGNNPYALKTLSSAASAIKVTADAGGGIWLLVGTDSGYEGVTRVYFTQVDLVFTPDE